VHLAGVEQIYVYGTLAMMMISRKQKRSEAQESEQVDVVLLEIPQMHGDW